MSIAESGSYRMMNIRNLQARVRTVRGSSSSCGGSLFCGNEAFPIIECFVNGADWLNGVL